MRIIFILMWMVTAIAVACTGKKANDTDKADSTAARPQADTASTNINEGAVLTDQPLIDSTLIVVDTLTGLVWMKNDFSFMEGRFLKK